MLLMEAQQLRQMIVEAREDGILARFTPILLKDWNTLKHKMLSVSGPVMEILQDRFTVEEITAAKEAQKSKPGMPPSDDPWDKMVVQATICYILANDPDPKKTFSTWIVTMFSRGFFLLEDLPRVVDGLRVYVEAKRTNHIPRSHDIGTVKTLDDFYALVMPFRGDDQSGEVIDRTYEAKMYEQADVLLDSDSYKVLCPKSLEAAQWFGRNTEWCTAWGGKYGRHTDRRDNYYHGYSNAPLYIIQRKSDGVLWQFSFKHHQFMDVNDRSIYLGSWMDENAEAAAAIGMKNFGPLLGSYGITLRHFTTEQIADVPPQDLTRVVESLNDFKVIPPSVSENAIFFQMLTAHWKLLYQRQSESPDTTKWRKQMAAIFNHYAKVLPEVIMGEAGIGAVPWLYPTLPTKFHTDDLKLVVASRMHVQSYKNWIPEPWSNALKEKYSVESIRIGSIRPSEVEKDFLTDEMIEVGCVRFPAEIGTPAFHDRITEDMLLRIISRTHDLENAGAQVTKRFQTRAVADAFYQRAKASPRDDECHMGIANLPYSMWPWRNTSMCMEAGKYLFCPYEELPPALQDSPRFTETWVGHKPVNFAKLPVAMCNEDLFRHAIADEDSRKNRYQPNFGYMKPILEVADTDQVKLEWVSRLFNETMIVISAEARLQAWRYIPVKFRSKEMVQWMGTKGEIRFEDPSFNADPVATARYCKNAINALRANWDSETRKNWQPSYKAEAEKAHIGRLMSYWQLMPESARNEDVLCAFADENLADIFAGVQEKYLTARVLTRWLSRDRYSDSNYGSYHSHQSVPSLDKELIFKKFPKSSWTAENMAMALNHGLIKKVPDDLIDDGVVAKQIVNYSGGKTDIAWGKVTASIVKRAVEDGGPSIIYAPWPVSVLSQDDIAWELLSQKDVKYSGSFDTYAGRYREAYKKPEARSGWTQRVYNIAVERDVIDVKDVPPQFRNDDADQKAIIKNPANIETIEDRVGWLNTHMPEKNFYQMMKYGLMNTPQGWIEVAPDVDCGDGFYTVVPNRQGKKVVFLFDRGGEVVNIIRYQMKPSTEGWNDHGFHLSPEGVKHKGLLPIRKTVAKAINDLRCGSALFGHSFLGELGIWSASSNLNVLLTEEMSRETVGSLTYTITKNGWKGQMAHIYFGDSKEEAGFIKYEAHGMNNRFEGGGLTATVAAWLDHARDAAVIMAELDFKAGSGQVFKESDFYVKLGIRGSGGHVWGSYLTEKVITSNKLSVWKGMGRIAVVHSKFGLIAVGKLAKDGTFLSTENYTAAAKEIPHGTMEAVFAAMKGKITLD